MPVPKCNTKKSFDVFLGNKSFANCNAIYPGFFTVTLPSTYLMLCISFYLYNIGCADDAIIIFHKGISNSFYFYSLILFDTLYLLYLS